MRNIMINEQSLQLMEENGQVISEGINICNLTLFNKKGNINMKWVNEEKK